GLVLKKGGAEVYLTGCNPLSTQDDVAAAVAEMGIETFGKYGVSPEEYEDLLAETLACHPHLIVDDGGDLINLLGGRCKEYADQLIGGCEETTTGIHRLKAREREGILPCPMMAVNDAKAKHYYDNKYGTGQSVWTAIMDTTNLIVAGKTVVVAGYGWCGKGTAMRAKGMGANVIITEIDPFKALDATMDGFRIMTMDEAAKYGDIFVTVTGCKDVITEKHFAVMKDQAILCNAGHFDCEVDVAYLRANAVKADERRKNIIGYTLPDGRTLNVLGEGRLVNLACGMGHPAEIMDMSFSVQALSLKWLAEHRDELETRVYDIPDSIDDEIGRAKLAAMGITIDVLTPEQEAYLSGWTAE
ncbi:MAG: adenosylhomocysteinase, partial [Lachnospiraceae bacterium]|nr:adenosylhomocysteinase [Lachnospiraceae bacterium]